MLQRVIHIRQRIIRQKLRSFRQFCAFGVQEPLEGVELSL